MPSSSVKKIHLIKSDDATPEFLYSNDNHDARVAAWSMGALYKADLEDALSRFIEFSMDSGTATGGSNTTCVDAGKSWATDIWKGAVLEVHTAADGKAHYATISANTATTITMGALAGAVSVASGDDYAIRLQTGIADIYKWGGTVLTGRDISLDLKALIDDSIKGVLRSLSDIGAAAGEDDMGLLDRIGELKATPTANTVLDRLKDIADAVALTPQVSTIPVIYNVTMTIANTEYSQALPANSKKFLIHCQDGTAFRLAYVTGKVAIPTAPYLSVKASSSYNEDHIKATPTIYVACAQAAKVVEIVSWS